MSRPTKRLLDDVIQPKTQARKKQKTVTHHLEKDMLTVRAPSALDAMAAFQELANAQEKVARAKEDEAKASTIWKKTGQAFRDCLDYAKQLSSSVHPLSTTEDIIHAADSFQKAAHMSVQIKNIRQNQNLAMEQLKKCLVKEETAMAKVQATAIMWTNSSVSPSVSSSQSSNNLKTINSTDITDQGDASDTEDEPEPIVVTKNKNEPQKVSDESSETQNLSSPMSETQNLLSPMSSPPIQKVKNDSDNEDGNKKNALSHSALPIRGDKEKSLHFSTKCTFSKLFFFESFFVRHFVPNGLKKIFFLNVFFTIHVQNVIHFLNFHILVPGFIGLSNVKNVVRKFSLYIQVDVSQVLEYFYLMWKMFIT